jgi:lipopolysaccharide/colanic/teichoic acid biosynthesis glycosyltransferase
LILEYHLTHSASFLQLVNHDFSSVFRMLAPTKHSRAIAVKSVPAIGSSSKRVAPEPWSEFQTVEEKKQLAFSECMHKPLPTWKRATDVVVSLSLLMMLSPLLAAIALFIRLTTGGPVFFKQVRLGEMGNDFVIYKFRTLRCCPDATSNHREFVNSLSSAGLAIAKPDLTSRLIFGGNLLRKTSLDELPQLINILKGEMSLIGPRPDVLLWEDYQPEQLRRFEVTPGVTGLWQVSGKNRLTFQQMIEKDIEYVQNRSFWLDVKIAMRTIRILILRDNA